MRREQAVACGQDGSLAVALDASTFEDKVQMVFVLSLQDALLHHPSIDLIVEVGRELLSPTVELEVEQMQTIRSEQSDEPMIVIE